MSLQQPQWRVLRHALRVRERAAKRSTLRLFSSTPRTRTDGVFRDLTDQRVQMPWVEAFRKQQQEGYDPGQIKGSPQTPKDRDLTPKKMKDSYHSVVRDEEWQVSLSRTG